MSTREEDIAAGMHRPGEDTIHKSACCKAGIPLVSDGRGGVHTECEECGRASPGKTEVAISEL